MRNASGRRILRPAEILILVCGIVAAAGLLHLTLRPVDHSHGIDLSTNVQKYVNVRSEHPKVGSDGSDRSRVGEHQEEEEEEEEEEEGEEAAASSMEAITNVGEKSGSNPKACATVEEMGVDSGGESREQSLAFRKLVRDHFDLYGAPRVRRLPPAQFCKHGFVLGKSSEAGFGNEMYKILTGAALSMMLNRSLIIGQTRGKFPFEDFISYTNLTFTLKEVKQMWRQNNCLRKYKRPLVIRTDDFLKPSKTNVLCSDWSEWKQPIIWFQSTTDAVGAQFFLKNVHPEMRNAASRIFGRPDSQQSGPNVFGELMRVLISPSKTVEEAVNWVIGSGVDPDISLHMRMLMNRSVRVVRAALNCIKKATGNLQQASRPRVVLVSDTPSIIRTVSPYIQQFGEVLHFDYAHYRGNISGGPNGKHNLDFRAKDWGPAPRWVAFVDFFLASRAKHAVVSGAQRRVGTTYAQLVAALAAANSLGDSSANGSSFSFFSSFHSNLLSDGLKNQIGWGHVWNRYAGPLSCGRQQNQCALTPLLPSGWWDGPWQSPIPRDIRKLEAYGVRLSGLGTADEKSLQSHCSTKKTTVYIIPLITT